MKGSVRKSRFVFVVLILLPVAMHARNIHNLHPHHGSVVKPESYRVDVKHKKADPQQVAGSRLPDCTHACGSCTPCRLVMVSFVCSSLEEAEPCPLAYKCMCHNKSYPVP